MSRAYSPTFPPLHLRHNSFSNPSVDEQSSFSNLSVTSPTLQLILQPFRRLIYVTAHSPTLPLLHLRHSSFSKPSFVSPKLCHRLFTYVMWRAVHGLTYPHKKDPNVSGPVVVEVIVSITPTNPVPWNSFIRNIRNSVGMMWRAPSC